MRVLVLLAASAPLFAQAFDIGNPNQQQQTYPQYALFIGGSRKAGTFAACSLSSEGIVFAQDSSALEDERGKRRPPFYHYYSASTGQELSFPAIEGQRLLVAGPFRDGRARAVVAGPETLFGYLDAAGAWAIPPRFALAEDFVGGYAIVADEAGRKYVIDVSGNTVLALDRAEIQSISAGYAHLLAADGAYAYDLEAGRRIGPSRVRAILPLSSGASARLGGARAVFVSDSHGFDSAFLPDGRSLADSLGLKGGGYGAYSFALHDSHVELRAAIGGSTDIAVVGYGGELILPPKALVQPGGTLGYLPGGYWTLSKREKNQGSGYRLPGMELSVYDLGGRLLAGKLCCYAEESEGSLVHVLFGNHDGRSFERSRGCFHGLFDLKTMKFAIDPKMVDIRPLKGSSLWLARDTRGACFLYDQGAGAFVDARPPDRTLDMSGGIVIVDASPARDAAFSGFPVRITTDKVNLRAAPSASSAVIDMLDAGADAMVTEISPRWVSVGPYSGFWMKVDRKGGDGNAKDGWVLSPFLDFYGYDGP